jgi:hypothetical protein
MVAPIGCPNFDRQVHLTIVKTESCVGAPTEAAPGAQFRGNLEFQVIEKKWSGREDLNLRPPGPETKKISQGVDFSIHVSGASTA